jgi:hypothetical protein
MGLNALADRAFVAPGEECVEQAVRAAVLKVGVLEAQPFEVVLIVRQRDVGSKVLARDAAGLARVGFCSGQSQASLPRISRARAVCFGVTL